MFLDKRESFETSEINGKNYDGKICQGYILTAWNLKPITQVND